MNDFEIKKDTDKISSINRTIRLRPEVFEKLTELSSTSGVSFNKIVNQCIEYALKNLPQ